MLDHLELVLVRQPPSAGAVGLLGAVFGEEAVDLREELPHLLLVGRAHRRVVRRLMEVSFHLVDALSDVLWKLRVVVCKHLVLVMEVALRTVN